MKPRILAALGTFAAAASLAMIIPASAQAAIGTLVVNDTAYQNPSGCITVAPGPIELDIINDTDQPAEVYEFPTCQGPITTVIDPGQDGHTTGASLYIP